MRLVSLASGSSGNCIYVGSDNTHLLVDVGISGKRIIEGLNNLELSNNDVDGIVITHEHVDHIAGLGVMCRKYNIPVYLTQGTFEAVNRYDKLGNVDYDLFHIINPDENFMINDIEIKPFNISHDAAQPVGYTFFSNGKKVAVATDMGTYNDYIVNNLKNMDAILIESNHDIRMLQVGPYPYILKKRILSDSGHLSNELSGRLISEILHDDLKYIFLGHLSKENNLPELAYETVRVEISLADNKYKPEDFNISVARRDSLSETAYV